MDEFPGSFIDVDRMGTIRTLKEPTELNSLKEGDQIRVFGITSSSNHYDIDISPNDTDDVVFVCHGVHFNHKNIIALFVKRLQSFLDGGSKLFGSPTMKEMRVDFTNSYYTAKRNELIEKKLQAQRFAIILKR